MLFSSSWLKKTVKSTRRHNPEDQSREQTLVLLILLEGFIETIKA
jgi:hypothetical protein